MENEPNYLTSIGTSDVWNDERGRDMEFIGALIRVAEIMPDKFPGHIIYDMVTNLSTFRKDLPVSKIL